jgi:uncharacterized coiled-coil protein SlyX
MTTREIEARLIRTRRTIALDLKAINDLERQIAKKRAIIARLQQDADKLEAQMVKAKR